MRTIIALLLVLLAVGPTTSQEAQFRARGELVSVDVAVFSGNRPVAGLGAADFALVDNGVPQKLELFSIETVPIDVTLVFDASSHTKDNLQALRESVRRISPMLASDSRIRLLSFSDALREVLDWRSPSAPINADRLDAYRLTTAPDALAMVLIRGGSGDRRHVVVLLTEGFESGVEKVIIRRGKLLDIAKRFDGVVHVILFERRGPDEFRDVVEATGGQLHRGGSVNRIAETFAQVFESFRQSYVLRYTPTGVVSEGWHEIQVKVTRPAGNRYTVRARKGYFVD